MEGDNSPIAGVLTGAVLGGFVSLLIIGPLYAAWRFGIFWVYALGAVVSTALAVFKPALLAQFPDTDSFTPEGQLHHLLAMPWLTIAIVSWVLTILTIVAVRYGALPEALRGHPRPGR